MENIKWKTVETIMSMYPNGVIVIKEDTEAELQRRYTEAAGTGKINGSCSGVIRKTGEISKGDRTT